MPREKGRKTTNIRQKWQAAVDTFKQTAEYDTLRSVLAKQVAVEKRVGQAPPERLGWAVTFAQRDLDTFTSGEWTDTATELRSFLNFPFGGAHPRLPEHPLTNLDEWPTHAVAEADIRAVQQAFRNFIEVLVINKWADTGELSVGISVFLTQDPQHPGRSGVSVVARTDSIVTKALWALVTLLTAYGDRLRQCPECRRFFVAGRTNQAYCSNLCVSRKTTREYRKRKEEAQ